MGVEPMAIGLTWLPCWKLIPEFIAPQVIMPF